MKGERTFFDTNVLIYAFAQGDVRSLAAESVLAEGGTTSVHVLNEFVAVATRKLSMPWNDILQALSALRDLCPSPVAITLEVHESAVEIAGRYGYHIYDSLVIAAALKSGCSLLLSEDMQDGQVIGELTIRNPFRSTRA